jgi:hypothetical protein
MTSVQTTKTLNGAFSLATSGSARLDLFFKTVRGIDNTKLEELLEKSWQEDPLDTLRLIFYNRDCRGGKGERAIFRSSIRWLINTKGASHAVTNIELISEYGRWEDLLWFITKPQKKDDIVEPLDTMTEAVVKLFAKQLKEDKEAMEAGKPVTLAAKWAPSENCKHDKLSSATKLICNALDVNYAVYRKQYIAPLRGYIKVLERFMCSGDWSSIDYSKVPGCAMNKLKKAFAKRDPERFQEYKDKLQKKDPEDTKTKVNAATVEPHELVMQYMRSSAEDVIIEEQWKVILQRVAELGTLKDCLAICDVSGSMSGTYMSVSIALGLLIATLTREPFKNQIITFSSDPFFHEVKGDTLYEQVRNVSKMHWAMTTNFEKVFNMILEKAVQNKLPDDEMPKTLFVISDMQFDEANDKSGSYKTHYELLQQKYAQNGYSMPNIVFWNVSSSGSDVTNKASDPGVALLSGWSPSTLKSILNGKDFTPYGVLRTAIDDERYAKIKLSDTSSV